MLALAKRWPGGSPGTLCPWHYPRGQVWHSTPGRATAPFVGGRRRQAPPTPQGLGSFTNNPRPLLHPPPLNQDNFLERSYNLPSPSESSLRSLLNTLPAPHQLANARHIPPLWTPEQHPNRIHGQDYVHFHVNTVWKAQGWPSLLGTPFASAAQPPTSAPESIPKW